MAVVRSWSPRRAWHGATVAFVVCAAVAVAASACGDASPRENFDAARDARRDILPKGSPTDWFVHAPIGNPITGRVRPQITNVQITDLDRDGLPDVLVCDAAAHRVSWIRQAAPGEYVERTIAEVPAPAHVEPVDIDGDGDLDLVVADLGALFPDNRRIGSVIVLENDGASRFTVHPVAEGLARVADVRAGDLDGDGDIDLAVAAFGYDQGETLWLENRGGWQFVPHVLQRLSGAINAVVVDINQDGHPDIVTLVSQEWEEVWAFVNDGKGHFTDRLLWGSTNADFGSSWITLVDLDRDGDPDVLYSNGDAFDYAPDNSRPWHGVRAKLADADPHSAGPPGQVRRAVRFLIRRPERDSTGPGLKTRPTYVEDPHLPSRRQTSLSSPIPPPSDETHHRRSLQSHACRAQPGAPRGGLDGECRGGRIVSFPLLQD
jgi:hypothetical protein